MAKCPKCDHSIPPYGYPFNGKWSVIICHSCKARLSIQVKDFYKWYLTPFGALSLSGLLLLKYALIDPIVLAMLVTVLSFYFYVTVGWQHTHLAIA